MKKELFSSDYKAFLKEIKSRIASSQIKATIAVNEELLRLYWDLAQMILVKQEASSGGDGLLAQIGTDLKSEFSDMKGFSLTNLKYMKQWYIFWTTQTSISQQVVDQLFKIPWGHHIAIITKIKNSEEAIFYLQKTVENSYSRSVLIHQIENKLYGREGKAITNFNMTLPAPNSDLAHQTLKDPYIFDFLNMRVDYDERELESSLVAHVTKFLLELGAGFSYIGRQYKLDVADEEFYIDLLFYHVRLHCYVVVELKTGKFKPEYAGKLSFYVSAVDGILRSEYDNPTIGILICKSKNDTVVEYALRDINKPIGVSEYVLMNSLPNEFKSSLPTIEEIEVELRGDSI
jgi:predicted nuclease of restriction endonuclease-like (RecB) superfamily